MLKRILLGLSSLLVLAAVNYAIWEKEQVLATGQTVLLDLAPRDPRSLMQGDYMVLNYRIERDLREQGIKDWPYSGLLVLNLDQRNIVTSAERYQNQALKPQQQLLRYRKHRHQRLRLGAESFFFQEGHADAYSQAKYGELRVDARGDSVLIGLRDEQLRALPLAPAQP